PALRGGGVAGRVRPPGAAAARGRRPLPDRAHGALSRAGRGAGDNVPRRPGGQQPRVQELPRPAPGVRAVTVSAHDVVVIGAGVVGASIAWNLARRGVRKWLGLEREGAAGRGSTSRATGGFRAQFATEVNVRLS